MSAPVISEVTQRIRQLTEQLCHHVFEREKAVRLALLSAVAGESIFLLGPPGVAKSMIARRLKYAFAGARSFEYLMGKFSTPDEVFGPVSISRLKNEDKYERLTDRYLPGANIVFLDEIWKASPPIQNALLTVLNEKIYRNGEQEIKVQIRGLVAASNELPQKGEGLEALWDRFLVRILLQNIEDETLFERMIALPGRPDSSEMVPETLRITHEEYDTWRAEIAHILMPPHVLGLMTCLRRAILDRNQVSPPDNQLYVSDRRWRKLTQLLRASAFLNGRTEVHVADVFLIADCIWDHPAQIEECAALVLGAIAAQGYRRLVSFDAIQHELEALRAEIQASTQKVQQDTIMVNKVYRDKFGVAYYRLENFWQDTQVYIHATDFDKLKPDQLVYIHILEQAGQIFKAFQTFGFLLKGPHLLENKGRDVQIETTEEIRETVIPQAPSYETRKIWDSQVQLLLEACNQGIKKAETRKSQDGQYLNTHLFVPYALAHQSLTSLDLVINDLTALKLDIQQTRHLYESLKTD